MVPASFDFWLANLNREASSAGASYRCRRAWLEEKLRRGEAPTPGVTGDLGCNHPRRRRRLHRYRAVAGNHEGLLVPSIGCNTDGMPTDIYFAGENVRVKVDEDPSQVAEALMSAGGLPFRLTGHGHRGEVYINPAMVAFWLASESSPEPEAPQDSPRPPSERQAVTDIWGKPLGKKRRR